MGKRKRDISDKEILQKLQDIQEQLNKRNRHASPPPIRRRRIRCISSGDETSSPTNVDNTTSAAVSGHTRTSASATSHQSAANPTTSADTVAGPSTSAATAPEQTLSNQCSALASPATAENSGPPVTLDHESEVELDEEILLLLGDAPKTETLFGGNVHKDIASRWQEILTTGLTKEVKDKILRDHLIPANCELLVPPQLNAEVKAALPDSLIKKDGFLQDRQKRIGIALAALANATNMLIRQEDQSKILKAMSDAGRILCDVHYNETKSRRSFIISATNANMKEALLNTRRDKYLFGENVSDTLKSAKTIQKSGADLKKPQRNYNPKFNKSNFYKNKSLNTRAPQRKTSGRPDVGKARAAPAAATTTARTDSAPRARRAPSPPRAARRPPPAAATRR